MGSTCNSLDGTSTGACFAYRRTRKGLFSQSWYAGIVLVQLVRRKGYYTTKLESLAAG